MKELDSKSGSGLIEKKRQGLGKPNLIYVNNVLASGSKTMNDTEKTLTMINSENKNGKTMPVKNSENVQLKSCKEQQLQTSKSIPVKSSEELQTNNTENNKIENSEIIYPSTNHKNEIDTMDMIEQYRQLLKKNMEFDYLMDKLSIGERDYLEEILELMLETICVQCDTVRIGSKDISYQLVKGRLLKINAMHIEYIIDCLGKTTNKICNIKGYLLAMLYNAPTTISSYYKAEVNYDMQNGLTTKDEYAV